MDELIFIFDDYKLILECIYVDENRNYYRVFLPKERLKSIYDDFYHEYVDLQRVEFNDRKNIVKFFDFDIDKIDMILKECKEYEKKLLDSEEERFIEIPIPYDAIKKQRDNFFKENKQLEKKISRLNSENVKLYRKNKFKNKVIFCTTIAMLSMLGYIKSGYEKKSNNSENGNSISYEAVLPTPKPEIDENKFILNGYVEYDGSLDDSHSDIESSEMEEIESVNMDNYDGLENKDCPVLSIYTDNEVDSEKLYIADAYYHDAIVKEAEKYGLDENVVIALCTHERGIHSDNADAGGGIGLFQIQIDFWEGREIEAYNFITGEFDKVRIVSSEPPVALSLDSSIKYANVSDVFQNIKVGCMLLQYSMKYYNYNIPLGITAYNYGTTYTDKVLYRTSQETGLTYEELKKSSDYEWLNYRDCISLGDSKYLENVFKYIPSGSKLTFYRPGINGGEKEEVLLKYNNLNYRDNNVRHIN